MASLLRRRRAMLTLLCFVFASAYAVQGTGVNQNAHFALVRALADGTPIVDAYRAETTDVSFFRGHYYAAKAPGLAFANLPPYLALDALGVPQQLRGPRRTGVEPGGTRESIAVVWALGLWSALLPAAVLFLLVRRIGDELEPGLGLAAAATLALGTMLLPFSQLLFAHSLSAALGFGAFALLWWRRSALLAGLLAGLAVVTEFPLALVALALGLYALRGGLGRATRFVAGAVAGGVPLALYNLWAFGSVTHLSYERAVSFGGESGHDELAANESGFFGVRMPSLEVAGDLLLSHAGLVTVTPVVAIALVAAFGLRRAEALLVLGLSVMFVIFNAGYETPFGGGSPGPRFLVPILPFLALAVAVAFRRWPLTTTGLAAVSALGMWSITATIPAQASYGVWDERLLAGNFIPTVGSVAGLPRGLAILPFVAALALAAFVARPPLARRDLGSALAAIAAWALVAFAAPRLFVNPQLGEQDSTAVTIGIALAAAGVVLVAAFRARASGQRAST